MKGLLFVLMLAALSASLEAAEEFRQVEEGVHILGDEKDGGVLSNLDEHGWRRFSLQPDENGEVNLWPGGPRTVVMEIPSRFGMIQGSIGLWDVMLAHYQPQRSAIPNNSIVQDVVYHGFPNIKINFIRAVQTSGRTALIRVLDGGIGDTHVVIRIISERGQGFQFSIDIWGR